MASSGKKPAKTTSTTQRKTQTSGATQPTSEPLSRGERRRQQFEQRRVERKQAPAKQQRDQRLMRAGGAILAAVILIGIGYGAFSWITSRDENRQPEGVVAYNYAGGNHTNDAVDYPESPPVGGEHNPAWQGCDYYNGRIANENAVHSLEHGAVWITYRSDISESDKEKLEGWANDRNFLLVSEYDGQESPFIFTAWNNQLPLDSLSDKKATQFMNYFLQGPQTPERGATCSGGTNQTLG